MDERTRRFLSGLGSVLLLLAGILVRLVIGFVKFGFEIAFLAVGLSLFSGMDRRR